MVGHGGELCFAVLVPVDLFNWSHTSEAGGQRHRGLADSTASATMATVSIEPMDHCYPGPGFILDLKTEVRSCLGKRT